MLATTHPTAPTRRTRLRAAAHVLLGVVVATTVLSPPAAPASTSRSSAWPPPGTARATGHLGRLYRPKYFHPDGIAVHGSSFVPPHPDSHGCARVTNVAMDHIWPAGLAPLGSTVFVHGRFPGT